MRDLLRTFGRDAGLNIRAIQVYARQLFTGLSVISQKAIIHADIKPDNILIADAKNVAKICDFGTALYVSDRGDATPYLGSRFYRAPEISRRPLSRPRIASLPSSVSTGPRPA